MLQHVRVTLPARIDLAGTATDVAPFRDHHGGRVINMAVDLDGKPPVSVGLSRISEPHVILVSTDRQAQCTITSWEELCRSSVVFSLPSAAITHFLNAHRHLSFNSAVVKVFQSGFRCSIASSIPQGSGMGISGAIGAGLAYVLRSAELDEVLVCSDPVKHYLAGLAISFEADIMRHPTGGQDPYAALFGGILDLTFEGDDIALSRVNAPPLFLDAFLSLGSIVHTGVTRQSGSVLTNVMQGYVAGDSLIESSLVALKALCSSVRHSIEIGNTHSITQLMNESWRIRQRMVPGISNSKIDDMMGMTEEATHGRMLCGIGGGGCAFLVSKPAMRETVFAILGDLQLPHYVPTTNSNGLSIFHDSFAPPVPAYRGTVAVEASR